MKTAGIIAEYNPFHNGHLYQIQELRKRTDTDFIIIIMSGNFVQRGEPAIFDKYTRAHTALLAGADLVLELPAVFSTSSAEDFASCAVTLLDKLGVADLLCFGSECGDLKPLFSAANLLLEEPDEYKKILKAGINRGESFPAAREKAICACLSKEFSESSLILSSPNNILGIEYQKALLKRNSSITPYTIVRTGHGYHDQELSRTGAFASASAIRKAVSEGRSNEIIGQVPWSYESICSHTPPIFPNDLSGLFNYRLLTLAAEARNLTEFTDISPELADRIKNKTLENASFTGRIEQLKTKQYTYTRISRGLLHILLGITKELTSSLRNQDYALYARVLGFRKESAPLLTAIKKNSQIPLITKTADGEKILSDYHWSSDETRASAIRSFHCDLYCAHVYESLAFQKNNMGRRNEFNHPIVIL